MGDGPDSIAERLAALEALLSAQQTETDALKGQIAALTEAKAALAQTVSALEAQLAAPACGEGLVDIGSSCMEAEPRSLGYFEIAIDACASDALRLCRVDEYAMACPVVKTQAPEFTGTVIADGLPLLFDTSSQCIIDGGISVDSNTDALHPFRCCASK